MGYIKEMEVEMDDSNAAKDKELISGRNERMHYCFSLSFLCKIKKLLSGWCVCFDYSITQRLTTLRRERLG